MAGLERAHQLRHGVDEGIVGRRRGHPNPLDDRDFQRHMEEIAGEADISSDAKGMEAYARAKGARAEAAAGGVPKGVGTAPAQPQAPAAADRDGAQQDGPRQQGAVTHETPMEDIPPI